MKKFFKILIIIILILIVVIIVTPVFFKGKILQVAKQQINKKVNAKVEFSNLNLSFIRNFPNASVVLKNVSVVGIDDFASDTLLSLKSFDIRLDVMSAIKMENINIKGILIDNPVVFARVLQDGKANWDIAKAKEEAEEEVDTTVSEFTTKISLKRFEIRDARIKYSDESSNLFASLDHFNFLLKGNLAQDFTSLSIQSASEAVNLIMDGIRYVKDAALVMNINLDADLKNSIYIFKENEVALNDLSLGFNGSVEMPHDSDIVADVNFATRTTDFKSLLSMVPAIYMQDFEDVETSGNLGLNGSIKGVYNAGRNMLPDAMLQIKVQNAMFKYPDLPKSADNIQIDVDLFYDGAEQ